MDITSTQPIVTTNASASRLPAGSMLEISPGIRVPHPQAEVNLRGAGDPRTGDTDAVVEFSVLTTETVVASDDPAAVETITVAIPTIKPLSDSVKVKG